MSIKIIIFDLGKVIFDFDLLPAFKELARITNQSLESAMKKFVAGIELEQYERGELSTDEYRLHVSQMMKYDFSEEEFEQIWNCIFTYIFPGIEDLIFELRKKYSVFALSNTNALHTKQWQKQFPAVESWFEKIYKSHEIGFRKPEKESYLTVLDEQKCNAQDALFIDDLTDNIKTAESFGLNAHLFQSVEVLRNYLKESSLI